MSKAEILEALPRLEGEGAGVGAVCKEDEDSPVLGIDPEGGSGKSVVAETVRGQVNSSG